MSAALSLVMSVVSSFAIWIRGNPVCCAGFILIAVNILCYVIDKLKKLLV